MQWFDSSRRVSPVKWSPIQLIILAQPIVVSVIVIPRKLIIRRLIATITVTILWQVEFLMFVIFDSGTVLIAPALPFSINAAWFHDVHLIVSMPSCREQTNSPRASGRYQSPGICRSSG